jgi:hypothetical protein
MYKILKYNKLYNNNNILNFDYFINNYKYIIFLNINKINKKKLFNLKNEILKLDGKSIILNQTYIYSLLNSFDFKFLGSNLIFIFLKNIENFIYIISMLDNIFIFFSFNKYISNIFINSDIIKFNNKSKNIIIFLHLIIIKFIFNIIIIILNINLIIIKILNIK